MKKIAIIALALAAPLVAHSNSEPDNKPASPCIEPERVDGECIVARSAWYSQGGYWSRDEVLRGKDGRLRLQRFSWWNGWEKQQ